MPHINVKCYPKNLTEQEMADFVSALNELAQKHLKATDDVVSIAYTEIEPENWGEVYHNEIKPNLDTLAKKPNYEM
ncbi:tautomerase PptA [Neisseria chenwenguii]|uniref:tautomerase PptA n=1 Tax=Neisseria chenwenguii TaxID=1853278 RepID=UPI000F514C49|nr:tautomerase PptA [Neisseria chenwenguii]ROV54425.1 tautomerase PptA [Neisseria chenwenguii]